MYVKTFGQKMYDPLIASTIYKMILIFTKYANILSCSSNFVDLKINLKDLFEGLDRRKNIFIIFEKNFIFLKSLKSKDK